MIACREKLVKVPRNQAQNAGLLLDKYLTVPYKDEKHSNNRKELFLAAIQACGQTVGVYQKAYERWKGTVVGAEQPLQIKGRLIVGLGNESILETGLALNHTYGTPLIPGTALKGLANHYCSQVWSQADSRFEEGGEFHKALFGGTDYSGHITFHDAWIEPASLAKGLVPEVLTPHHSAYYVGNERNGDVEAPSDFDDPTPVTFLAITGKFRVVVSCDDRSEAGKKWESLAIRLLADALKNWGIGAKTSSDYGKMIDEGEIIVLADVEDNATGAGRAAPRRRAGLQNRDKVTVTRVEDPKGKGRVFFVTAEGHRGTVAAGDAPNVEIGETCELWISAIASNNKTCIFSAKELPAPKVRQQNSNKQRRR